MEKKRKLPARAAARVEQMAKRRTLTPPERRSETPAPPPEPEAAPAQEAPPPLPTSVQPGKPLPTVEEPQSEDLPAKDYQLVSESGVLSESLVRSRRKWISEGIFERYWTKPYKRKGVLVEDPNNPPKESMTRIGQITITVEPHVFDVTMFAVKDPKSAQPPPVQPNTTRPILQYGPPNGVMPPPPPPPATPSTAPVSPAPGLAQLVNEVPKPAPSQPSTPRQSHAPTQPQLAAPGQPSQTIHQQPTQFQPQSTSALAETESHSNPGSAAGHAPSHNLGPAANRGPTPMPPQPPVSQLARPMSSPRGMESILSPSTSTHQAAPQHRPMYQDDPNPPRHKGVPGCMTAPPRPPATPSARPAVNGGPQAATPGKPAPGTDPIILTLAEKAGEDPELRDLMKRVAQGEAAKPELERFQSIIDEITAESKRRGTPGPSADRLLVDGQTVRYFANEVGVILDIVLASNPKQTSANLRPPDGSNPLVVALVKKTLDDIKTRDMVRRIADDRPQFSDATDLKAVLDGLKREIARANERLKAQSPAPSVTTTPTTKVNGLQNGLAAPSQSLGTPVPTTSQQAAPQQLRSKGPPPPIPVKSDISAIVFEFSGGNGDRYLFPKFSVLEYVPVASGQQVIASFLIVRKGSTSEYPVADPALDYYQPVTIRLYTPMGRHLDHLARVVAPQDEVRRYMNDIMDKMTRAEYILLAMRLPRPEAAKELAEATSAAAAALEEGDAADREREKGNRWNKQPGLRWINHTANANNNTNITSAAAPPVVPPTALWTTKPLKPEIRELPPKSKMYSQEALDAMNADGQYQSFISSVSRKEPEEV